MSRSLKRSPFTTCCCGQSDKPWKCFWHRKMRAATKAALHGFDEDNDFLPHQCEVSDVYDSRRDWWMRFDPRARPELMRK